MITQPFHIGPGPLANFTALLPSLRQNVQRLCSFQSVYPLKQGHALSIPLSQYNLSIGVQKYQIHTPMMTVFIESIEYYEYNNGRRELQLFGKTRQAGSSGL